MQILFDTDDTPEKIKTYLEVQIQKRFDQLKEMLLEIFAAVCVIGVMIAYRFEDYFAVLLFCAWGIRCLIPLALKSLLRKAHKERG